MKRLATLAKTNSNISQAGGVVSEVYGGSFTITADKVWAVE
jgi:hypothetical protein